MKAGKEMNNNPNVLSLFDLTGETAVVTGGGQGIGQAIAMALAEAGADIVVAQRRLEVAEETAQMVTKLGRKALALKCDVSKESDVENLVKTTMQKFGKLDIMVNNAGVAYHTPTTEMTDAEWQQVIGINLSGVFYGMKHAAREMLKKNKGSIINISSICGLIAVRPQPQIHYDASKGGVISATRRCAVEWATQGVRVNTIAPGYVRTPLLDPDLGPGKIGETWVKMTPMGRVGELWEMKGAALFLASKASTYMTGSVVVIDGGYTSW
jgi:NAD(P)-dependent dehydrogenase (short-subunit alcohol dehydrogenase family)